MNQVQKLNQLADLSYFDRSTLDQIVNINKKALYENISRWINQGKIIQLKKGLYVTADYYNRVKDREVYAEFIANHLRFPSYLSLEYILQKHGILSESVFAYTSVTLKTKRDYENELGRFVYRNINKDLFTDFEIKEKGEFAVKQAGVAKALFDYLYLKLYREKNIDKPLLDSFRLNLEELKPEDKSRFNDFCQNVEIKKYKKLPDLLFQP